MGTVVSIIKTIKKIEPPCVVMVKIGNFYYVYGKDSYILSYLFEYKMKEAEGVQSCGFPSTALQKVKSFLEKTKLNYIILEKANNFEEVERNVSFDGKFYNEIYLKSEETVNIMSRIQKIVENLHDKKDNDDFEQILESIEEILNETI